MKAKRKSDIKVGGSEGDGNVREGERLEKV